MSADQLDLDEAQPSMSETVVRLGPPLVTKVCQLCGERIYESRPSTLHTVAHLNEKHPGWNR